MDVGWRLAWPPLPLARHHARRAALTWLSVRLAATLPSPLAAPLAPSPPLAVGLALLLALAAALDLRLRHERHFLGNLGVAGWTVSVVWGATVLALELLTAPFWRAAIAMVLR